MADYYDRQGNPLTLMQWAKLVENFDYKVVAQTEVGFDRVSTIWLGLNHNWWGGPPLIFETMIFWFCPDQHDDEQECWRYPTEEAALAGHDQAVAYVKEHANEPC